MVKVQFAFKLGVAVVRLPVDDKVVFDTIFGLNVIKELNNLWIFLFV